uniref:PH domain-containing protein n=1 Tax=Schistocephalus solidus TaxID=70667 RepID=A0A183SCQ1_SCHSO
LIRMFTLFPQQGKKFGVESHTFAVMTASDLETWLREIVNGAQKLLTSNSHLSIACRWRGLESRLLLHQDFGLTLVPAAGTSVDNGANHWNFSQMTNHSPSTIFWSFPFERLRSTADDGCSILWLNFGEDGEQVAQFASLTQCRITEKSQNESLRSK